MCLLDPHGAMCESISQDDGGGLHAGRTRALSLITLRSVVKLATRWLDNPFSFEPNDTVLGKKNMGIN